jgi:hypothetical protein
MKGFMSKIYLESYRSELPPADYKVTGFEWLGSALHKYPAIRLNSHVIMQCSPWTLVRIAALLCLKRARRALRWKKIQLTSETQYWLRKAKRVIH